MLIFCEVYSSSPDYFSKFSISFFNYTTECYGLCLKLLCWIAEWAPWDIPDNYKCEVVENYAPVPKHVPLHRPGPLPVQFYETLKKLQDTSNREPPLSAPSSESQSKE